jgi:hypothetical protein
MRHHHNNQGHQHMRRNPHQSNQKHTSPNRNHSQYTPMNI